MLVVIIVAKGLIVYKEFIIDLTVGVDPVSNSWIDSVIKEIVKGRIWEAFTRAEINRD